MISKVLNTTDGKIKITIPSDLSEITLGMMIDLQNDNTDVETIGILSGISLDELYNVRNINDFELFREHVLSLVHQITYNCDNLPLPKSIFIVGRQVEIIKNLSIEPAGAFMECRNIIADEINEHIKIFGEENWKEDFKPSLNSSALILAHYLYCPATGLPYDDEKAEAFKSEVLKLSITLTVPISKYFFLNYPNLWKPKIGFWQAVKQLWKRKQALRNLRRSNTSTR